METPGCLKSHWIEDPNSGHEWGCSVETSSPHPDIWLGHAVLVPPRITKSQVQWLMHGVL